MVESRRLAEFSRAVRESTLKRLRAVPEGRENYRPDQKSMNFADIIVHLIECDRWLFTKLRHPETTSLHGKAGIANVTGRPEFMGLINKLEWTGHERSEMINRLDEDELSRLIFDDRFGGEVTVWWLIVRGNLDHEIHHRGQIATYLHIMTAGR